MNERENRRPLKVRDANLAQRFAKWLSQQSVTPNQISIASVGFAMLAAACLLALPHAHGAAAWALPLAAAALIQCRLLCNLFDGMVAVEGGKGTAAGELFRVFFCSAKLATLELFCRPVPRERPANVAQVETGTTACGFVGRC